MTQYGGILRKGPINNFSVPAFSRMGVRTLPVGVALHFMGHDVGWHKALILESLCQVACAAAFVMPANLGAQEAAYMTIGTFLGVQPAVGLALSLVQRVKDVLTGILGLLVWQGFEGRLWGLWRGRHGECIRSFTIIEPDALLRPGSIDC